MPVRATAPGKLVLLGEYAVLSGAPALVMAVNRRSLASIGTSPDSRCHLEIWAPTLRSVDFEPGRPSGIALVDRILAGEAGSGEARPWRARLDSSALFSGGRKLGLGSSAAALVAWAGAWSAWRRRSGGTSVPEPALERLIAAHRAFQGGGGSGLDVAAALLGGVFSFELGAADRPRIGSVRVPNSVGFAGIFAGSSASTPDWVARYRGWVVAKPAESAAMQQRLGRIAELGRRAARTGDSNGFLAAAGEYGDGLEALGAAMGADIVTAEHRQIRQAAAKFGVVYKTSGAGGGDVGLALSVDPEKLAAFTRAVAQSGFQVVELAIDEQGLIVEELTE